MPPPCAKTLFSEATGLHGFNWSTPADPLPVARCRRQTTLTTLPFRLPLPATELRILPDVARESRVAAAVLDGDESLYFRIIESAEHARKVP